MQKSWTRCFTRRTFLGMTGASASLFGAPVTRLGEAQKSPLDVGFRKQLFVDKRFIEFQQNVQLVPILPDLQRESFLAADKPWESGRVCSTGSVCQHGGKIILWYDAREWDPKTQLPKGVRYCYAQSDDGVHFHKPNAGIIEWQGSKNNNMVLIGGVGTMFVDSYDVPAKRFKALVDLVPELEPLHWSELDGVESRWICLFTSPGGLHWTRAPKVVFPMWLGSQQSILWDDRLEKWVLYLRAHRPHRCFGRTVVDRGKLEEPYQFWAQPGRSYDKHGKNSLKDELPIVMDRDGGDPQGGQTYMMNAWKYPEAEDVYLAFVPMWYEARGGTGASDRVEAQLAVSRDGIQWNRPWRRAVISPGAPSMDAAGQIWPLPEPIVRGSEVWLYYLSEPDTHLSFAHQPNYVSPKEAELMADRRALFGTCLIARAIWRLDRFVAADSGPEGGEILTPLIRFSGSGLMVNANAGASGQLRIAIENADGTAIPGLTIEDSVPIQGNGLVLPARWKNGASIGQLAGKPVKLRFRLTNCQLFSFQAVAA